MAPHRPLPSPRPSPAQRERGKRLRRFCLVAVPSVLCFRRERFRRCRRVIEFDDGFWLFGVLRWGSPSGPAPPLAITPALSRPAGEGESSGGRVSCC